MKLLIVDDQTIVTEGLRRGVNWAKIGFDNVETACSAQAARNSLQQSPADVMLCDIEMPGENGLDLLKWIQSQHIKTLCIFLTAHAKFSYAQEAMRLGAFDYIIQPASYAEISQVTARALREVHKGKEDTALQQMGRAFNEQSQSITAQAIRAFLGRQSNQRDVKTLQNLGIFPRLDQDGYVVLIQVLRWETGSVHWEKQVLAVALNNIAAETFSTHSELSPIASMDEQTYAMFLQNTTGQEMPFEGIIRQLIYIGNVAEQYLHCILAFYLDDKGPMKNAVETWEKLLKMKSDNVALCRGVFRLKDAPRTPHLFRVPQVRGWNVLLRDGYAEAMEREAMELLDKMANNGELTAETLRIFYQDFMQMLYFTIGGSEKEMNALFNTPESLELYRNGTKSIDDIKALIQYVANNWKSRKSTDETRDLLKKLQRYIDEHLESNLHRDELAEVVHLNGDYLTRMMKKETGYSLKEYVIRRKMETARTLLRSTMLPVGFIAARLGYSNFSHFSYTYKKVMGVSPQEERHLSDGKPQAKEEKT